MNISINNIEEDTLLDAWDTEFSLWIRNGPAYKAYSNYIADKKKKKLEESLWNDIFL